MPRPDRRMVLMGGMTLALLVFQGARYGWRDAAGLACFGVAAGGVVWLMGCRP